MDPARKTAKGAGGKLEGFRKGYFYVLVGHRDKNSIHNFLVPWDR